MHHGDATVEELEPLTAPTPRGRHDVAYQHDDVLAHREHADVRALTEQEMP